MVLALKRWKSRAPPGFVDRVSPIHNVLRPQASNPDTPDILLGAGWSSPVARQAHNLKAAGSNPAPATKFTKARQAFAGGLLCVLFPQ